MAQAILGDPKVIILDEPTVGLDPMQIIEFRELVKELGKEHTVILSSHILAEIAEICQKIMIISKGKLIAIDTPDNLSHQLDGGCLISIKVREADSQRAVESLQQIEEVTEISQIADGEAQSGLITIEIKGNASPQTMQEKISVSLMEAKCPVMAIEEKELSLEDIFIKILDGQKEEER
jgi:ABC-2 type transport system ATP-binding protein